MPTTLTAAFGDSACKRDIVPVRENTFPTQKGVRVTTANNQRVYRPRFVSEIEHQMISTLFSFFHYPSFIWRWLWDRIY